MAGAFLQTETFSKKTKTNPNISAGSDLKLKYEYMEKYLMPTDYSGGPMMLLQYKYVVV